jgi:acyl-CoA hydrolase
VVTEYGIAYLFGKNIRQRAYHLIKIAHPDHRERLEKEAFDQLHFLKYKFSETLPNVNQWVLCFPGPFLIHDL